MLLPTSSDDSKKAHEEEHDVARLGNEDECAILMTMISTEPQVELGTQASADRSSRAAYNADNVQAFLMR